MANSEKNIYMIYRHQQRFVLFIQAAIGADFENIYTASYDDNSRMELCEGGCIPGGILSDNLKANACHVIHLLTG